MTASPQTSPSPTADPTLRADLDKDPAEVAAMFDQVARRYDLTNTLATFGQVYLWRRATVRAIDPRPGMRILDLAAGTGTSAAALADLGADVTACDFSAGMIDVGRQRYPDIEFVQGDAMDLPFADDYFDAVTISYGLRNVAETEKALREMLRVTRPGGRLVICEFSTPTAPWFRALYRFYLDQVLTRVARAASSDAVAYDYLAESILDWPDQLQLGQLIADAGWTRVQYHNLTGGIVALHRATKARS